MSSTHLPPTDLPPITPPSIESGDIPRLALVAQLAALLSMAGGDGYSSRT